MDLHEQLPILYPLACEWAEQQSKFILNTGTGIDQSDRSLARAVGVRQTESIRILIVPNVPSPEQPLLKAACAELNFLGAEANGLTLSYGVFIKAGFERDRKLLAHEFRHVAQYEQHSSIASYLSIYLSELTRYGYSYMPLELDAEAAAETWGYNA